MKIESLHIKNFKSIVDLNINEPNNFTVFVGPNGSGKSNIFEALEYASYEFKIPSSALQLFGGKETVSNFNKKNHASFSFTGLDYIFSDDTKRFGLFIHESGFYTLPEFYTIENDDCVKKSLSTFVENYNKLFINKQKSLKLNFSDSLLLNQMASNLEKVLDRLLQNEEKRQEISEWLALFIPEFDRIEVQKSEYSGNENILIYQKHYDRPFGKDLISDGTYNIIALLVAVYQSDEPQFLCIEEPENGLTPDVIKELVNLFRTACKDKGHYIWLNTHSQTLVSELTADEIITVNKINGETKIKQFKDRDFHGLRMDEVWLSNGLGGGLPW